MSKNVNLQTYKYDDNRINEIQLFVDVGGIMYDFSRKGRGCNDQYLGTNISIGKQTKNEETSKIEETSTNLTIGTKSKGGNKMERTYAEVVAENKRTRMTIGEDKRTKKQIKPLDTKGLAFQVNGKK